MEVSSISLKNETTIIFTGLFLTNKQKTDNDHHGYCEGMIRYDTVYSVLRTCLPPAAIISSRTKPERSRVLRIFIYSYPTMQTVKSLVIMSLMDATRTPGGRRAMNQKRPKPSAGWYRFLDFDA
jgi:hypothetical protein